VRRAAAALPLLLLAVASCAITTPSPHVWEKVELDLDALDSAGLRGPADGKVAVAYEFAIPNTPACREEVRAIDRTVEFMAGARGRVNAGPAECLCIGSTHQPGYRSVLGRLAGLPYVRRIIECHFE
jgi:hypothetical protein